MEGNGPDCGGLACPKCDDLKACGAAADCTSGVCTGNICQAPTCADTVSNGDETDVDCGGPTCVLRCDDALACAIGALDGEPVRLVRAQVKEFDRSGPCTLIGGGHAAPDRAALYNSALVRYLDFNDSYLAKGETCHPSDNLGAVLAAAEYADASGRDFLAALALAYQVQCRLSDVAPVRDAGFDPVLVGTLAETRQFDLGQPLAQGNLSAAELRARMN